MNASLDKPRSLALLLILVCCPFVHPFIATQHTNVASCRTYGSLNAFAIPVSELEKDLTPAERSVTSVVRKCGPSVAYVTSIWPQGNDKNLRGRRRGRSASPRRDNLPYGESLGSGSGFLIGPGYVCTNYHVIERAFQIQETAKTLNGTAEELASNVTSLLPWDVVNNSLSCLLKQGGPLELPQVFVRLNSATEYLPCRVVGVEPDIDVAVLKVMAPNNSTVQDSTVSFGSSSELIVGQTVVALGSPFGLENTVTTGVVSAVNREFRSGTARTPSYKTIRNCIQTDAAINPGNSGGPLLNLKGEVVGINTAIISTSGSNAGIGFAVPSDQIRPAVDRIVRQDRINAGERPNQGWLGVSIVDQGKSDSVVSQKNWVVKVDPESPADEAGIRPLRILESGVVRFGDAIVAVGGNEVKDNNELRREWEVRVQGEQIAVTLEDSNGERRVVYVVLTKRPC